MCCGNKKTKELPDDPIERCGYFWFSLPQYHPFTPCCAEHDKAYGTPTKTILGAFRRLTTGQTDEQQSGRWWDFFIEEYEMNGTALSLPSRKEVDLQFLRCMKAVIYDEMLPKHYEYQALAMYYFVRLVGGAFWPRI